MLDQVERAVRQAWWRLRLQRFADALMWCLAGGLLVVAVVLLLEKFHLVDVPGAAWLPLALVGGLSVLVATLVAALSGPGRLEVAAAVDHAFALQERLSSALSLPGHLHATEAGRALLVDANQHAGSLEIGTRFGVKPPRRSWVPLVPALLALAVWLLPIERLDPRARARGSVEPKISEAAVKKQAEGLSKKLAEARKKAEQGKLDETSKLLAEVEKLAQDLTQNPPATREQAMVELNKLSNALQDRQKQLGGAESVQRQLQQLKDLATGGLADELARELARGDFRKAASEVQKLRDKMASGKLTDAEKQQLASQLRKTADQLQKLANMEERKKMLDEALKNGGLTKEQHKQEMAKLQQQSQQLEQLQKLAQQMAQAQQAMQQGDMNKAAQSLGMTQEQLQQLAQQAQELETLEGAMAEILESKAGLSPEALNQIGESLAEMNGLGGSRMGNQQGNGGRGRGQGDRPEAPDDVSAYATRTPQQYTKGAAVVTGFAPPRGLMPGESVVNAQEEAAASTTGVAEALSNQKIPSNVKKHVVRYFDQIREGK